MASLFSTLKPVSPFSPLVNNALLTHHTPNSKNSHLSKRGGSVAHKKPMFLTHKKPMFLAHKKPMFVAHKKQTFVAAQEAPDQVESSFSSWRIPMSEVVVVKEKRSFWDRSWNYWDVSKLAIIAGVHLLSLAAPFYFSWAAFHLYIWLYVIIGFCVALSYHRNLSHRSFDLPKWLEYLFAYGGLLAFQGHPIEWVSTHRYHHKHCDTPLDPHSPTQGFWFSHITWILDNGSILEKCGGEENVSDLVRQPFYRFLRRTIVLHQMAFALLLYTCGGMPFLVWGLGVASVARLHSTFLVNSVSHIWGTRDWNTSDLSKNNWLLAIVSLGEWHNNHHAFEFSAKQGLEWWQFDGTWCLIRFLEAIGLATNVKLPTEAQKKRMALV